MYQVWGGIGLEYYGRMLWNPMVPFLASLTHSAASAASLVTGIYTRYIPFGAQMDAPLPISQVGQRMIHLCFGES